MRKKERKYANRQMQSAGPILEHRRRQHDPRAAIQDRRADRLQPGQHWGHPDPGERPAGFQFTDDHRTALVIATGPSCSGFSPAEWPSWPALCINDAWQRHPGAAAIYAADGRWWRSTGGDHAGPRYIDRIRATFAGEAWTCDEATARQEGIRHVPIELAPGLGKAPGPIRSGGLPGNSGAQGINLAYRWGARRIVLVGFDMCRRDGKEHYFGDHPKGLTNGSAFAQFVRAMGPMAVDLHKEGVEVVNTCLWSALPYWPKKRREEIV